MATSFEYQDNNPDNGVTGDADWSFDDVARSGKSPDDEDARPQLEAHELTLREHLLEQIRVTVRTLRDRALLELTDALDESGYLEEPLEDIHAPAGRAGHRHRRAAISLKLLQSLDPAGVGARSAGECLALQIRRLPKIPFVTRKLALRIVEDYLPLFAQRDFNKIKKALDCDDEDLREAQAVIRQCRPHPGAEFARDVGLCGAGCDCQADKERLAGHAQP
jgi:RNA polymerase sigma-54 factor